MHSHESLKELACLLSITIGRDFENQQSAFSLHCSRGMTNALNSERVVPIISNEAFTEGKSTMSVCALSRKSWGRTNGSKSSLAGQLFENEFVFSLKNPERNFFVL